MAVAPTPQKPHGQYVADPKADEGIVCVDVERLDYLRQYFGSINNVVSEKIRRSREEILADKDFYETGYEFLSGPGAVSVLGGVGLGMTMQANAGPFKNPKWSARGAKLLRASGPIGVGVEVVATGFEVTDALRELDGHRAVESAAQGGGFVAGCAGTAAVVHWGGSYVPVLGNAVVGAGGCIVGGIGGAMIADKAVEASPLGEIAQSYLDGMRDERIIALEKDILGMQRDNRGKNQRVSASALDTLTAPLSSLLAYEDAFVDWGIAYENKLRLDKSGQGDFETSKRYYEQMQNAEESMKHHYQKMVGAGNAQHNPEGISEDAIRTLYDWQNRIFEEQQQLSAAMASAAAQDEKGYGESAKRINTLLANEGIEYIFSHDVEKLGLNEQTLEHYRFHFRLEAIREEITLATHQFTSWKFFNGAGRENGQVVINYDQRDKLIAENQYLLNDVMPLLRERGGEDKNIIICQNKDLSVEDFLYNGGAFSPGGTYNELPETSTQITR